MTNNVTEPHGALVLHHVNAPTTAVVYLAQHRVAGQMMYLTERITCGGDDHQALANLSATMLAELTVDQPDGDLVCRLAAAIVYTAGLIANLHEVNCLSARMVYADAGSVPQIDDGVLAVDDPLEFLARELGDTLPAAPASAPITLPELMDCMTQEVEAFWRTAPAGEMWPLKLIASTPSGLILLECPHYDDDHRSQFINQLRQRLVQIGADSYVLASETWQRDPTSDLPPSQQANRREVMLVCAADKSGATSTTQFEMVRDATGRVTRLVPAQDGRGDIRGWPVELLH